jgi:hypothetical protein
MKQASMVCLVACLFAQAFNTQAIEGGNGHYVSGQYADFSGMPPTQPGFFFGNYFLDYANATIGGSKELPFGGIFAAGVTANLTADVPLAIYAYPFDLPDITLSSGIAIPFVWSEVKATATFDRNNLQLSTAKKQSVSGLGDIQLMPVMAAWTNGDLKLAGMFNIWAASGDYDTGQLANRGLGYWTFEPMLGFSWLSSKIGTEFSFFTGVDFNTKNNDADYQSGDIFHVDATLAQHLPLFGGFVGAGATAFYLKQISGDSGSGARLGSFEAESYGVGPTVSYVHSIGKSTLVVDGSWLPQLHSANTTKGNYWWVKLTLAF